MRQQMFLHHCVELTPTPPHRAIFSDYFFRSARQPARGDAAAAASVRALLAALQRAGVMGVTEGAQIGMIKVSLRKEVADALEVARAAVKLQSIVRAGATARRRLCAITERAGCGSH